MSTVLVALVVLGMLYLMIQSILKPQWALLLVLSFLPLEQLLASYVPLLHQKSWIINVGVGIIAMTAFGLEFLRGKRPFAGYFNPAWVLVIMLYVFTVFGVLWSPIPEAGRYFIKSGFPYYMLLLVILPGLIRDLENIRKFMLPFMIIGSVIILLILISPNSDLYAGRLFVDLGNGERGSPLATAELGGALVIVAALYRPVRYANLVFMIRVGAIFAGMGIMVLSGTRGQLLFAMGLSVLFFPVANRIKNTAQFLLTSAAGAFLAGILFLALKLFLAGGGSADRWSTEGVNDGISVRMYYATTMLQEYLGDPGSFLGGLGTGAFNAYVRGNGKNFIYPHNLLVEILTEHGLIGFGLLIAICTLTFAAGLRLYRALYDDPAYRSVLAILLALCAYGTLISMKQSSFAIIPLPFYWYLVLTKISSQQSRTVVYADDYSNDWSEPEDYSYDSEHDAY